MDSSDGMLKEQGTNEAISGGKSKRDAENMEEDAKSAKKKSKKSSKEHKSQKEKRQKRSHIEDKLCDRETPAQEICSGSENTESSNRNPVKAEVAQLSKVDFFANLVSSESQKPAVGTVHTVGKKVDKTKKGSDWTCPKCSTSNQNNSHQCHKCKAIKRMTEYR